MRLLAFAAALLLLIAPAARAEDGYDLWLRYKPVEASARAPYAAAARAVAPVADRPGLQLARAELVRGLTGLLGQAPATAERASQDGVILLGLPQFSHPLHMMRLPTSELGREGYLIRTVLIDGKKTTVIAAPNDIGVLYGVYRYLSLIQTRQSVDNLDIMSSPKVKLRMLNHWDNLNRTVERGYSGQSIFDWWRLPGHVDPRLVDYARANASIGINGTVLNNVNAKADSLTPPFIAKAAAVADTLRPYGIRVYLSARFSAPIEIGGLKTADPADPAVAAFWKAKADELYKAIPDFGGFLVKANSEGQPGPQDYGRTHVDGANMLADAVGPYGGVVIWRAFVYSHEQPDDRAKQGYNEFKPFDGQFRDNVVIQVKNGAIDFQPREPFHPLFGAMPKSNLGMEFQITKEYLGFSTHLVYLGPLYEETLKSDTMAHGKGSTVAKVVDGSLDGRKLTVMAGVANIGSDRNWSGSQFDQANWYVFGRLAWDPEASARDIAADWARMTFTNDPRFVKPVVDMMMGSREAAVDYMTPLGLHHQMGRSHHYGPGPWVAGGPRADWTSVYYAKAGPDGIGFDRTPSGSNATAQYAPAVGACFADLKCVDEKNLLWFHHLSWDYRLKSGDTLWDGLVKHYGRGVAYVDGMNRTWAGLAPYVDPQRHAEVADFLKIQRDEAQWWRDASVAWFGSFSKRPLPAGEKAPAKSLEDYEAMQFPYAPGN
ncbi:MULTISPECIES: alpha-glucuronidase family glycosyl hydrolase [unclassified Caulobacter]|uniref:alpha-glucuronidase family glycosyl hydrolase n=1 Tax=unclassified Caulobacter TaxID=2648921 RepID=UPI0006F9225C|nr:MULTISPECIES: alpha-glucuronidase family glycosyl hydrolase [unclassified Caulobacter]KQV56110.1 alpha-glucuronidase [Caulobacter sp. Root342]KQV70715.1 alpha-glucuronidase [Caulobacter sp. Root343]